MIRVIRLMEYTYPDIKDMDADMLNWYVPPNGSKKMALRGRLIRSAVITEPVFPEEEKE